MFAATFYGAMLLYYLLNYGQNEVLKAWSCKNTAQEEFEFILSKLEEAIITKDTKDNSISYSNKKGKQILNELNTQPLKQKLFKIHNFKGDKS